VPPYFYFEMIVLPLLGMGMGGAFLYGIYRTVNHWIERRHERELAAQGGGLTAAEVERLSARLEVLEDLGVRLQELEERVDFAERVLAQARAQPGLPRGDQG
jgi:hypothetical protein